MRAVKRILINAARILLSFIAIAILGFFALGLFAAGDPKVGTGYWIAWGISAFLSVIIMASMNEIFKFLDKNDYTNQNQS